MAQSGPGGQPSATKQNIEEIFWKDLLKDVLSKVTDNKGKTHNVTLDTRMTDKIEKTLIPALKEGFRDVNITELQRFKEIAKLNLLANLSKGHAGNLGLSSYTIRKEELLDIANSITNPKDEKWGPVHDAIKSEAAKRAPAQAIPLAKDSTNAQRPEAEVLKRLGALPPIPSHSNENPPPPPTSPRPSQRDNTRMSHNGIATVGEKGATPLREYVEEEPYAAAPPQRRNSAGYAQVTGSRITSDGQEQTYEAVRNDGVRAPSTGPGKDLVGYTPVNKDIGNGVGSRDDDFYAEVTYDRKPDVDENGYTTIKRDSSPASPKKTAKVDNSSTKHTELTQEEIDGLYARIDRQKSLSNTTSAVATTEPEKSKEPEPTYSAVNITRDRNGNKVITTSDEKPTEKVIEKPEEPTTSVEQQLPPAFPKRVYTPLSEQEIANLKATNKQFQETLEGQALKASRTDSPQVSPSVSHSNSLTKNTDKTIFKDQDGTEHEILSVRGKAKLFEPQQQQPLSRIPSQRGK